MPERKLEGFRRACQVFRGGSEDKPAGRGRGTGRRARSYFAVSARCVTITRLTVGVRTILL
jgi:hypothetical protein